METQKIDVMVADASHEVYVDTILETIKMQRKYAGQELQNVHTNMLQPR